MLAEAELDAVVIAAPTTAHLPIALAAIERGLPLLVEKPLAASAAEALRDRARRARGAACRSRSATWSASTRRCWSWGGCSTPAGCRPSTRSPPGERDPFPARIRDVGVTVDLATHDVDILSWVAGERPARVYAETARRIHAEHEDLLFGLLHFPSGATGMLDVNWLTPAKRRQLVVVGEEGMFELDYLTQRLTFTRATDTTNPKLIGGYAPDLRGRDPRAGGRRQRAARRRARRVHRLSSATAAGRVVDGEDGLWAVALAEALLASAAERRPIELAELPELAEIAAARQQPR